MFDQVNWWEVGFTALGSAATIILLLVLRNLLEFRIAPKLVKFLSKVPTRGIEFRKHPNLKGIWDHKYETEGGAGSQPVVTNDSKQMYQFSNFFYSEFVADGEEYYLLARIDDGYLTGDWRTKRSKYNSYSGGVQLKVVDERTLRGRWMGFSKSDSLIRHGTWEWTRTD